MSLLQAVEINGSISAAARSLGMSYRHVWGELKRWEHELGNELIIWEKGQSARLSTFGAKLMWAERQAQARLAPQIEALSADLERAFAVAFDPEASVLTLYASHDDALPTLRALAAREHNLHLDVRFTGSVDAIAALNAGRCIMAGFHTRPQPAVGSLAQKTYQPLLQPGLHKIIGFGRRTQGLPWSSHHTPPWLRPLRLAPPMWAWASKARRAHVAWVLWRRCRRTITWFA